MGGSVVAAHACGLVASQDVHPIVNGVYWRRCVLVARCAVGQGRIAAVLSTGSQYGAGMLDGAAATAGRGRLLRRSQEDAWQGSSGLAGVDQAAACLGAHWEWLGHLVVAAPQTAVADVGAEQCADVTGARCRVIWAGFS